MPNTEEVNSQLELLQAHRRTLAHYLRQQAIRGEAYVEPGTAYGIREARENIARVKSVLHGWDIPVEEHPDDKELPTLLQTDVRYSIKNRFELEHAYCKEVADRYIYWNEHYASLPIQATVTEVPQAEPINSLKHLENDAFFGTSPLQARPIPRPSKPITRHYQFTALKDALFTFNHLLLLGTPGGGKTIALQRLALDLANLRLSDDQSAAFPVIIRLGRIAPTSTLVELLTNELKYAVPDIEPPMQDRRELHAHHALAELVPALLAEGRLILLWDGLNETPQAILEATARKLDQFRLENSGKWPGPYARSIVSCRKDVFDEWRNGYRGHNPPISIQQVTIERLEEEDKDLFIERRLGSEHAKALQVALEHPQQKTLKQLARTPLLLKMICDVYGETGALPASRGALLHNFVRQLENKVKERYLWEEERHQDWEQDTTSAGWIDTEVQKEALKQLSYAMTASRKQGTSVGWRWARRQLQIGAPKSSPERLRELACAADMLDFSNSKTEEELRFSHQLIQEYFAALALETRIKSAIEMQAHWWSRSVSHLILRQYATPGKRTGWEETVLLLAGLEGKDGYARGLIRTFLSRPLDAAHLLLRSNDKVDSSLVEEVCEALLAMLLNQHYVAGECAEAIYNLGRLASLEVVSTEFHERVRQTLIRILHDPNKSAVECIEAGRSLGLLGDSRLGVINIEPDWCEIPEGYFWLGCHPTESYAYNWEKPNQQVYLPTFRISRYPVTNAQWQQFMKEGGPDKLGGYWRVIERQNWTLPRWAESSIELGEEFLGPNQPVVNISWYQAQSYCHWLSNRLGYPIYLPSEAQWEKAARGPDGRPFPWGYDQGVIRANTEERAIDTTTPVGCYPNGVSYYGLLDMAGNTWEWADSPWTWDHTSSHGIERYQEIDDGKVVIRGGGWDYSLNIARCTSRYLSSPSTRSYDLGFRVATGIPEVH